MSDCPVGLDEGRMGLGLVFLEGWSVSLLVVDGGHLDLTVVEVSEGQLALRQMRLGEVILREYPSIGRTHGTRVQVGSLAVTMTDVVHDGGSVGACIEHGGVGVLVGGLLVTGVAAVGGGGLHETGVHHRDQVLAVLDHLLQVADLPADHVVQVFQVAIRVVVVIVIVVVVFVVVVIVGVVVVVVGHFGDVARHYCLLESGYSEVAGVVQVYDEGGESAESETVDSHEQPASAHDLLLLLPGLSEAIGLDSLKYVLLLPSEQSIEESPHDTLLSLQFLPNVSLGLY